MEWMPGSRRYRAKTRGKQSTAKEKPKTRQTMASQPAGYMARPGRGSVCFTGRTAAWYVTWFGWPIDRQALSVAATAVLYFFAIGWDTRSAEREREREGKEERELSATRLHTSRARGARSRIGK